MTIDQTSIAEGIGGVVVGFTGNAQAPSYAAGILNVRQAYIQGIDRPINNGAAVPFVTAPGHQEIPNTVLATGVTATSPGGRCTRRYQVNFGLGLFTQGNYNPKNIDKLIPTKFMASQLAIEITLADASVPILAFAGNAVGSAPTYALSSCNLIPEVLEFDAKYDEMFLAGLREGGV